jgi:hypothetical protein
MRGMAAWDRLQARTGAAFLESPMPRSIRSIRRWCLLALLLLAAAPLAQAGGEFLPTGDMTSARAVYGVAKLHDGRVLYTGGIADFGVHLQVAELYEPASGTFVPAGPMTEIRMRPTVATLADGRVLVFGGRGGKTGDALETAELYDPASGLFSSTGSLAGPRYVGSATLLPDGRVLVAGGLTARDILSSAELYDPATGTFSPPGDLLEPRVQPETVRLADGRVLIAGGDGLDGPLGSAEIYDPVTGTFSATGPMVQARSVHSQVLLVDGRVLIVGGSDAGWSGGFPIYYTQAELFDPATGTFSPTGSLAFPRELQSAALLPDGRVLVAGGAHLAGNPGSVTVPTAEIYDPATGTFSVAGDMAVPRYDATAITLADRSILFAGGWAFAGDTVGDMPTDAAERFVPDVVDPVFADGFEGAPD